jgi:hypothetical protein
MNANPDRAQFDMIMTADCGLEFGAYYPTHYRNDDPGPRDNAGRGLHWTHGTSALPTRNDRS